jgi:CBS domain containing-hemolysin-like protein
VYEKRTDNIIGMVHLKDIFAMLLEDKGEKPLKDLVRPIMFVPESLKISQLLREFRQQHMHIAIVLNEHGSITGLITLEDVLEEIVGEISDEHEPSTEKILPLLQGGWLVDGSVPLEHLSELLQIEFKVEDSVTLGGFLTEYLQHLPKKGERVIYKGYYFQVQKASPKRVNQVLIFEEKNHKE